MSNSNGTLFRLECVLLFALDVVKGPYIHSCAPTNPPEVIRSFIQPPAAAITSSAGPASSDNQGITALSGMPAHQRRSDFRTEDSAYRTALDNAALRANATRSGGFAPPSPLQGNGAGTAPLNVTPLPSHSEEQQQHHRVSFSPPQGSAATSSPPAANNTITFTGPSSLATSIITARASSSGGAATVRPISSSLLTQRRLLGLAETITPDDSNTFAMGTSVPNNASVSEDNNTIFAISPQTNLSESQQTLPNVSPMVGSFPGVTNASMTSNTGVAATVATTVAAASASAGVLQTFTNKHGGEGDYSAAPWIARCANADDTNSTSNSNSNTPSPPPPLRATSASPSSLLPQHGHTPGLAGIDGIGVQTNTTSIFCSDSSSSPLATPLHTPPNVAAFANPGAAPEPLSVTSWRKSEGAALEPLAYPHQDPYTIRNLGGGSRGGGGHHGGLCGPYAASITDTVSEEGRINSYNDVFVPRSEFCRRVLWLYPAESGLLFLYYAEDIPGEHYQRKTLRYSLCLVFCVDKKRMTIGAGLLRQLVQPYSVVLTNIAEELREAEVKYAYMSRGLQAVPIPQRPPPPPRQQKQQNQSQPDTSVSLLSPISAATPPPVMTPAAHIAADTLVQQEETEKEGEWPGDAAAGRGMTNTTAAAAAEGSPPPFTDRSCGGSNPTQKPSRFGRRIMVNESSARSDTNHLALVELSVPAIAAAFVDKAGTSSSKQETAAADQVGHDTSTCFMTPPPPNSTPAEAKVVDAATGGEPPASEADSAKATVGEEKEGNEATRKDPNETEGKADSSVDTTEAASAVATSSGNSSSPPYILKSRTTTVTTPLLQFDALLSPPALAANNSNNHHDTISSTTTATTTAVTTSQTAIVSPASALNYSGGNAEASSASAVSPALTDADTVAVTVSPSFTMRSRNVSQGGINLQASSTQEPAIGDSPSTTMNTTAPSPMSVLMASSGPGAVAGPFPSASRLHFAEHSPPQLSSTASLASGSSNSQYRGGAAGGNCIGGGGSFSCAQASSHNVNTLNAFITPTTAPQWTPLSELVEELYRCLRYSGDNEGGDDGTVTASFNTIPATSATIATAIPEKGFGGLLNIPPYAGNDNGGLGKGENNALPRQFHTFTMRPGFASAQGGGRPAGMRQNYPPLIAMLGSGNREPFETLDRPDDGGKVTRADGHVVGQPYTHPPSSNSVMSLSPRRTSPSLFPMPLQQQQQRGDFSVVHLSDRLSFHVRRMAPLRAARLLHLDHVPVPIVAYDPAMIEWMDMAVHHVFRLVDGVRTVADLVFGVAMGTTTTLAEIYAEALQRCSALAAVEAAEAQTSKAVAEGGVSSGGGSGRSHTSNLPARRTARSGSSVGSRDKTGIGEYSSREGRMGSLTATAAGPAAAFTPSGGALQHIHPFAAGETQGITAKASQRGSVVTSSPPPLTRGALSSPSSARARVVSVPIDVGLSLTLLPGVRYSVPTSAAAAAAAAAISDGQAPLPSFVNVCVEMPTLDPAAAVASVSNAVAASSKPNAPQCAAFAAGAAMTTAVDDAVTPRPHISVELPVTWVVTSGIVIEALLHLELCHLIKIYRPWTAETLYSVTPTLQRILRSVCHPARQILAQYLLRIAWVEQQQSRLKRQARRRAAAEFKVQREVHHQQQLQREERGEGERHDTREVASAPQRASPPLTEEHTASGGISAAMSADNLSGTQHSLPTERPSSKATLPSPSLFASPGATSHLFPPAAARKVGSRLAPPLPSEHAATSWPPAAMTIPKLSSVPKRGFYSDPHAQPSHGSPSVFSSGDSSLPRPPAASGPTAGGSGSGGGLEVGSNSGTHASSTSTSYLLSCSLKHTVCVGTSGKLQINLTSSLPTSPMLHSAVMTARGRSAQRATAVGSHSVQCGFLGEGLLPPAESTFLQPMQYHHSHTRQRHHLFRAHSVDGGSDTTSEYSTNSNSNSSSGNSSAERNNYSRKHGSSARQAPSSSSGSSSSSCNVSGCGVSQQASSPVSFKRDPRLRSDCQNCGRARRTATSTSTSSVFSSPPSASSLSASRTTSATSSSSATTGAAHSHHIPHSLPTLLAMSALPTPDAVAVAAKASQDAETLLGSEDALVAAVGAGASTFSVRPAAQCAGATLRGSGGLGAGTTDASKLASASAELGDAAAPQLRSAKRGDKTAASPTPTPQANAVDPDADGAREKRKRSPKLLRQQRRRTKLRVFVPTDAELTQGAAAALCALAKFSSTSVASVQAEMRRLPVWAPAFNHWSDRCVRAMVEVALLNNWLEDVSR